MTTPALPADLLDGFVRFRHARYATERARFERLAAEGQRPATMIVACSDSRSVPETVFDAHPGELFVVRNVAGLVPVYEPDTRSHGASAALEYGVLALGIRNIVVMGHGHCGGVAAAFDSAAPLTVTDFVGTWVAGLRDLALEVDPGAWEDPNRARRYLEFRSVEQSIQNLRTFPWIRARENAGQVNVFGCWFDIGLGELHALRNDRWERIPDA